MTKLGKDQLLQNQSYMQKPSQHQSFKYQFMLAEDLHKYNSQIHFTDATLSNPILQSHPIQTSLGQLPLP